MYEHVCMENAKGNYWSEMYDNITNYNECNNKPLSNEKIREAIDQVILEDKTEADNIMVDAFSPHRNGSEYMIDKVTNMTINNEVRNDLIRKFANLTINYVGKI